MAAPDEDLFDVLGRLEPSGSVRILVMDEGRLVGIVTAHDISWLTQQHMLEHHGTGRGASG